MYVCMYILLLAVYVCTVSYLYFVSGHVTFGLFSQNKLENEAYQIAVM